MSKEIKVAAVLTALLAWCGALLAARFLRTGSGAYAFLVWNLFLAIIPLLAAAALTAAHQRRSAVSIQALWFAVWLTFFPNAPYIITDFVHLKPRALSPLWYDMALLLSFAGTGLLIGYASLVLVQRRIESRFGRRVGWAVAGVVLFLSAFGIYLGRFLGWNSWDIVADPVRLFADLTDRVMNPLAHARTFGVTVIYGAALLLGYLALRVLGDAASERYDPAPVKQER